MQTEIKRRPAGETERKTKQTSGAQYSLLGPVVNPVFSRYAQQVTQSASDTRHRALLGRDHVPELFDRRAGLDKNERRRRPAWK